MCIRDRSRAPVSFESGVQSLTAMSTMKADLVASALAMKEVVFGSNKMTELGFGKEFVQVPLHIDNTATLRVIGNRAFTSRTKHFALRFFYIRELVKENKITTHYISTENQLADVGTKHLNKHLLQLPSHDQELLISSTSTFFLCLFSVCVFLNLFLYD